jgi:hypothetical protein
MRCACNSLVGQLKGLPGRPELIKEDNTKIDLKEIGVGCDFVELIHEAQDMTYLWDLVNVEMKIRIP